MVKLKKLPIWQFLDSRCSYDVYEIVACPLLLMEPMLMVVFNTRSNAPSRQYSPQNVLTELTEFESTQILGGLPVSAHDGRSAPPNPTAAVIIASSPEVPSAEINRSASATTTASWSQSLQAVIDQPPASFPRYLLLGGLAFFCVFGTWAWFGTVQEVSRAQGKLVPQGEVYRVQPVVQGKVTHIFVNEGEQVKLGQAIVELDNQLAVTEVDRLKQALEAYQQQLIQIQALMERTQLEAQTKQRIALAESSAQKSALAEAEVTVKTQVQLINFLRTEQRAYQDRLARLRPLLEAGAIAAEQLFEVEQSVRDRQRMMVQGQGDLERAQAQVKQLSAVLAQRQAEEKRTNFESQQRLQQLRLDAEQLQAKIQETKSLLQAAQTNLDQTVLQAPVGGTISYLSINNVGEVAQPGQTMAEIAPHGMPLVLSAVLPSQEAGLVRPGMAVQVKFDAFPFQDYGIVAGTVLSISPDALVDERLGSVYKVKIKLERNTVSNHQHTVTLKAGQTAQAEIVVRRRRIIDLILDPFRKLQRDNLNL